MVKERVELYLYSLPPYAFMARYGVYFTFIMALMYDCRRPVLL